MKLLDIATQLAVREPDRGRDIQRRTRHEIYRSLYCDHLPALRDAGFVAYHHRDDMITVSPAAEQFERFVER